MRVLELLVSTDLGGGPAHVRDVVSALAGPDFRFTVAGPAGGALVGAFTAAGAAFAPLAADRLSLGALRETVRLARATRAQVIHSHGKGAGLYGRIAARLTGAAAIHTFHGIHHAGYSRLYLSLERLLARWSHAVIHVSASQGDEARALGLAPPGRTHVIVNGVDAAAIRALAGRAPLTRAGLGLRADALVVATVARFDPVKGLDVLLRALPLLAARVPAAQLLIVGDGPERERLHALAREVAPGGRVVFAGAVPDAARLLPSRSYTPRVRRSNGNRTKMSRALAAAARRSPANVKDKAKLSYTVKKGDSLGQIAEWYSCRAADLRNWNDIPYGRPIHPGEDLVVWVPKSRADQFKDIDEMSLAEKDASLKKAADHSQNDESLADAGPHYVVRKGDTLDKIAKSHNVTILQIQRWNNLRKNRIYPGQSLIIHDDAQGMKLPPPPDRVPAVQPKPTTSASKEATTYRVKKGDTLWSIAQEHGVSIVDLKSWNGLGQNKIKVGQKLVIQGDGLASSE